MEPTKILHTADSHLGYRQYHEEQREQDFLEAFQQVITHAVEDNVDAVVHAGDIFNRSRPDIRTLSNFAKELRRLDSADVEFLTIVGNHDGTRDLQWPELFEDLDLGVYLDKTGYQINGVTVYGQDYVAPSQRSKIEYTFEEQNSDCALLVAHGIFTPFPHADWDLKEILTRSNIAFDGVLLGDDHTPRIEQVNGITATYPGSTERTAADQTEKRGYNVVTIEEDDVSITHETIDTRPFRYVDVELLSGDTVDKVIGEVEDAEFEDGSVVIVTLTGEGDRVPTGDIERAGLRHGALTVEVNDRREFDDEVADFEAVEFTDPGELVEERKQELGLSPVANGLEELARDVEGVPQSNLKDEAEARVKGLLDEKGEEAFRPTGPNTAMSESQIGDGDGSKEDASDAVSNDAGEDGNNSNSSEKQMDLSEINNGGE